MNYRHIYHAGNFADVFKHIIVTRIIEYLKRKAKAFRVIDTHAGIGIYDLSSLEAQKTGEWHEGIQRFFSAPIPEDLKTFLCPWCDIINTLNNGKKEIAFYPGSPVLIRQLLRKQDRLTAIELHDEDYRILAKKFTGDYQTKILHLDGWLSLNAHLPPKEKRGFILIDPPFEKPGEFSRLIEGLMKAYRRFSGGIYALWYPVKYDKEIENFLYALYQTGIPKILQLEMRIRKSSVPPTMCGSGMILINPPYLLEEEIKKLSPFLLARLGQDRNAQMTLKWIQKEHSLC
ncbi:23S rRNA (adenine(2030)-N(6))-methyltransferase RlmJ [Bartonella vinsonii]|uniref:Ribosomal RNA large subunit methyltransferase J n=2 Tax=Bartonella vinsonii subsp. berkhoffii TaxID=40933 RepID=N6VP54_BARVB|nr:23S rRNA (adenine(2030)-N(6))-methyltransferase RlmJ [Bartonella vinsonii]AGF75632.1 putative DNA methylase protein [Bartonella vinsonii subsp. berkhoffii str. Winnie]ENN94956.1 putative DNA methylase protein [Bartonella vinsonii subsp. berkhoffii str. Tweed]